MRLQPSTSLHSASAERTAIEMAITIKTNSPWSMKYSAVVNIKTSVTSTRACSDRMGSPSLRKCVFNQAARACSVLLERFHADWKRVVRRPCHDRALPGHPRIAVVDAPKSWVAGPSPVMTQDEDGNAGWASSHDETAARRTEHALVPEALPIPDEPPRRHPERCKTPKPRFRALPNSRNPESGTGPPFASADAGCDCP
jgi:hypothetical protein